MVSIKKDFFGILSGIFLSAFVVGILLPDIHHQFLFAAVSDLFIPKLVLNIEKQEELEVIVNGYTGPITAGVKRLVWGWGDGAREEGWFPKPHQYTNAGMYRIQVTAEGLFGRTEREIFVTVPPSPPKLILGQPLINGLLVTVNGFVQGANKLTWNWGDGSAEETRWFPASHTYAQKGIYKINVHAFTGDGSLEKTILIAIPRQSELVTLKGKYSGFYDFPRQFFEESIVPARQILCVTDGQYQSLKKMHNGIAPYDFTKITYKSSVYGATTPDGIVLGDAAFPGLNAGNPRWEVMAHEQGHNFFGGTSAFYYSLAAGYPFLQESFAVLSAFYTYQDILERQKEFKIAPATVESLHYDFANGRSYQEDQYNLYVSQDAPFDIADTLTSQALDYKMIVYGEKHGWQNYTKFTKAFEDGMGSQFTFQDDGVSATEQSTYAIAALGVAFDKDFREEFKALNFPVDDGLYEEAYQKIETYVFGKSVSATEKLKRVTVFKPKPEGIGEKLHSILNQFLNLLK